MTDKPGRKSKGTRDEQSSDSDGADKRRKTAPDRRGNRKLDQPDETPLSIRKRYKPPEPVVIPGLQPIIELSDTSGDEIPAFPGQG